MRVRPELPCAGVRARSRLPLLATLKKPTDLFNVQQEPWRLSVNHGVLRPVREQFRVY